MLNKVQWKHFHRTANSTRYFTNVHIYDTNKPELDYGFRSTLCGKRFNSEDKEDNPSGKVCKKCQRLAEVA